MNRLFENFKNRGRLWERIQQTIFEYYGFGIDVSEKSACYHGNQLHKIRVPVFHFRIPVCCPGLRRGISLPPLSAQQINLILTKLQGFTTRDFKITLGSIIEHNIRAYHVENGFRFLRGKIQTLKDRSVSP